MLPPSSFLCPEIIFGAAKPAESCVIVLKHMGMLSVFAASLIDWKPLGCIQDLLPSFSVPIQGLGPYWFFKCRLRVSLMDLSHLSWAIWKDRGLHCGALAQHQSSAGLVPGARVCHAERSCPFSATRSHTLGWHGCSKIPFSNLTPRWPSITIKTRTSVSFCLFQMFLVQLLPLGPFLVLPALISCCEVDAQQEWVSSASSEPADPRRWLCCPVVTPQLREL